MGKQFAFHKSVQGYGHIQRGQPCEDASVSFENETLDFYIAVTADGHGQQKSFRSQIGSAIATEVSLSCLKEAAEAILSEPEETDQFYSAILESNHESQIRIRQLTDTILSRWSDAVWEDYRQNPPSEEELGEYAQYYENETNVPKIYGTTLIAALRLPKCLILLQQGDGRCDVIYEDGSVDQPIPWDDRCEGNRTTSVCDEDAADSIRHCVIDLSQKTVIACYLGSDGVEDAYRTMEGTHVFYKDLSCILAKSSREAFESHLTEMLPEFSARGRFGNYGSMDDVSIAGIADKEALIPLIPQFRKDIRSYELEERVFWQEDLLRSKVRKHGVLHKRMEEAENRLSQVRNAWEARREAPVSQLPEEPGTYVEETEPDAIQEFRRQFGFGSIFLKDLLTGKCLPEQQADAEMPVRVDPLDIELLRLEEAAAEAREEFRAYDSKYQEIVAEIERLRLEQGILRAEGE